MYTVRIFLFTNCNYECIAGVRYIFPFYLIVKRHKDKTDRKNVQSYDFTTLRILMTIKSQSLHRNIRFTR